MDLKSALKELSAQLPEEAIERTKTAQTKKGYDTTGYRYQYVVDRLNEVLGVDGWRAHATYEVEEYTTRNGTEMYEVTAFVTIELTRVDADGRRIILADRSCHGGHASLTKADALKGAFTNGFKKTAALFGVGASAYRGTVDDDNQPRPEAPGHGAKRGHVQQQGRSSQPAPPPPSTPPRVLAGGDPTKMSAEELRVALETLATFFGGKPKLLAAAKHQAWPTTLQAARDLLSDAQLAHHAATEEQIWARQNGKEAAGTEDGRDPPPRDVGPPPDPPPPLRVVETPPEDKAAKSQPPAKEDATKQPNRTPDGKTPATDARAPAQAGQARSPKLPHMTHARLSKLVSEHRFTADDFLDATERVLGTRIDIVRLGSMTQEQRDVFGAELVRKGGEQRRAP